MNMHLDMHGVQSVEFGEVRRHELLGGSVYYTRQIAIADARGESGITLYADTREALEMLGSQQGGGGMNNADMPAMPVTLNPGEAWGEAGQAPDGLTKREHIAAMAMQGLLANPDYDPRAGYLAEEAVTYANALLAELERTGGQP